METADRELRQVDALFQDLGRRRRFAARSVAGVESPARLARFIRTRDWTPLDARIRVSDVATVVRNLSGEQLYGNDLTVPLRELIQNACDAVRARRLLTNKKSSDEGGVTIRVGVDEGGNWIEVDDVGVGMSTEVLTGPFLDFGKSFWGSAQMREPLSERLDKPENLIRRCAAAG